MTTQTIITMILGGTNIMTVVKLVLDHKKRNSEAKITEANALRSMQEQYNVWIKDSQFVQDNLREDLQTMRTELSEMKKQATLLAKRLNVMNRNCTNSCHDK